MTKYDYSKEKVEFLKNNVKGITLKELTKRFNQEFNCNMTEQGIRVMERTLKLTNGRNTRFKKGQTSWNKGKKMSQETYEKLKPTMFQKGNLSNARPVGSERIDVDGYTYIKVAKPNKWKRKHRVLWEEKYGTIPKGYKLIFADGNKQNLNFDNLVLVSDSELFILNKKGLIKNNSDLTKAGVNIARVIDRVNKRKEK